MTNPKVLFLASYAILFSKFLYYPQVKFLEKTLNMKGNEHLRTFFQIDPMLATMSQEDFAIKALALMSVLKL